MFSYPHNFHNAQYLETVDQGLALPTICKKILVTINVDSMLFRIFFIYLSDGCSTTVFVWAALYLYNCVPILNSSFSV